MSAHDEAMRDLLMVLEGNNPYTSGEYPYVRLTAYIDHNRTLEAERDALLAVVRAAKSLRAAQLHDGIVMLQNEADAADDLDLALAALKEAQHD